MKTSYDIEEALNNPKSVTSLVVFLHKIDLALLDRLEDFVNLENLNLLDGKNLTTVPPSAFKLKKLTRFRLRDTGITQLPEAIENFNNLDTLIIEDCPIEKLPDNLGKLIELTTIELKQVPIRNLPDSIGNLQKLEHLQIHHSSLETLPESIGQLKALKHFELSSKEFKTLPDAIGNLEKITFFELEDSQITTLPASFNRLKNLEWLILNNNQLNTLPELTNLKKLRNLKLENNAFEIFPEAISSCVAMYNIDLEGNKIQNLPESLSNLKELKSINLRNNQFEYLPEVLLDWTHTFALDAKSLFSIEPKAYEEFYEKSNIFNLVQLSGFQNLSRVDKIIHFKLYIDDPNQIALLNHKDIRAALNSKVSLVADNALKYLTQTAGDSLNANSRILILGKTSKDKETLQEQLTSCGLYICKNIQDNPSHILVSSKGNKNLEKLPEIVHWQWITEAQVNQYIDLVQPTFLIEKSSEDAVQQVQNLVMTLDEENWALAMELITGGGLPPELTTEVFIIYKLSQDDSLRKRAKELLLQKAATELKQVVQKQTNIRYNKSYYRDEDYKDLREKLLHYTQKTNIDLGKLAYATAMKCRFCHVFALENAPKELKIRILEQMISSGKDFYQGYHESLKEFPIELTDFPQLKTIHIHAYSGTWEDNGWKDNTSFKIPEEIAKLTALEELSISPITLFELPINALSQLKNLKKIYLKLSSKVDITALQKALPNCEFMIGWEKEL